MRRLDRWVLGALQALVVAVPLLVGGRSDWTLSLALPVVLVLLAITLRERMRRDGAPRAPGLFALAAFVLVALATTVPLPPGLLEQLSPATARLYGATLPGWPAGGEWSVARALAIDPYGVWTELCRFAIAFGTFAVIVAYPWESETMEERPRTFVFERLLLTLIGASVLFSLLALVQDVAGNGYVLWVTSAEPANPSRVSGPFVNPNHLAAWLEMVIPLSLGYTVALTARLGRRLAGAADTGRRMGVRARRAWMAALIANQRRLWPPVMGLAALMIALITHAATGSRGGRAALLVGLAIAVTGATLGSRRQSGERSVWARWAPAGIGVALVVMSLASLLMWASADNQSGSAAIADGVDVSLGSRLAVAREGRGIVRDFPLFGTGLGSWLHAYRPYQAPPVEGGIWDHAHDDYLELLTDGGVVGALCVVLFMVAVANAARRKRAKPSNERALTTRGESEHRHHGGEMRPPGFERAEWQAALKEIPYLRWGLAGGVAAILVHSFVDFGLRMPANLLLLMVILALLVLRGRPPVTGRAPALGVLAALLVVAAVPLLANAVLKATGRQPLSPTDALEIADLKLGEEGDVARGASIALVRHALDWSPADRSAHEQLASALGPGRDGDDALRRAIALSPWAPEVRDALALRLWDHGKRAEAEAEIEESIYRFPYLVSHAYLSPEGAELTPRNTAQMIRALADGDTMTVRLSALDDDMAAAIERGLQRALDRIEGGEERVTIVDDLVTLMEVRGRFAEAAAVLNEEGDRSAEGGTYYARAAKDYLKAKDEGSAERALLAALERTPEQGDLYRDLAVRIYAERGDFDTADTVLEAGERNAVNMMPVYRGTTEVLTRREAARSADVVGPVAPRHAVASDTDDDGEDELP